MQRRALILRPACREGGSRWRQAQAAWHGCMQWGLAAWHGCMRQGPALGRCCMQRLGSGRAAAGPTVRELTAGRRRSCCSAAAAGTCRQRSTPCSRGLQTELGRAGGRSKRMHARPQQKGGTGCGGSGGGRGKRGTPVCCGMGPSRRSMGARQGHRLTQREARRGRRGRPRGDPSSPSPLRLRRRPGAPLMRVAADTDRDEAAKTRVYASRISAALARGHVTPLSVTHPPLRP